MFDGWRASLELGLARDLPAARRQAVEAAAAADRCVGSHDALVASYGGEPAGAELAAAAARADQGYAEIARYLRADYAPRAADADAVGAERYAVAARLSLGADLDLTEAYQWGWAELRRIEAEMTAEAEGSRRRQRGRGDRPAQRIRLCDRGRRVPGLAAGPARPGPGAA